ncbi:MAG: Hpt domain-containing protein [Bdellovibrionales bacterium]
MTDPVNLENLREMTGGDADLEKELFSVYLTSSEDCLTALRNSTGTGQEEEWRTQAHAWKGMSLNLGAQELGSLCATAQMEHLVPEEKKKEMLAAIEAAYEKVKAFLKGN